MYEIYLKNGKIMSKSKNINVVTIGGGNGSYGLLSSIRDNDDYNISAIISMSDSGGSTGILREEFNMLPPGDVRRAIMALSREHEIVKQLFDYRYDKGCSVGGHNLGNLIITAMSQITGNFDKGLKQVAKMFKVKGRVIPVTLELSHLNVELQDGNIVEGETNIDLKLDETSSPIKTAYLTPEVNANPKAVSALEKADYILLSFGDLYTSVIPNLLVKGIKEAIVKNKKAKVVYFCNLMTKPGETTDFEAIDFIDTIEKYLGVGVIDYFVVNNGYISEKLADKYKSLEKKKPVKVKSHDVFEGKKYEVIEADLLHENTFVRHSYDKIGQVIKDIIKKN
ncbi:MAG: YvcK family protein [Candidatus Gracilibacteria bacterium]|nr:YvcK family protein [Candidatus Gracilibacteria bacterium]